MPAANPRVSVTLTPSMDAILKRLSDVSGQSKSSIIAEILEQSHPVFERMAAILETAKTATQEAKERMASNLEDAHAKLLEQAGIVGDLFEEQTADLVGELEQIGRRKGKVAAGGARGTDGAAATPASRIVRGGMRRALAEANATPLVTRGWYPGNHPEKEGQNCHKANSGAGWGGKCLSSTLTRRLRGL
uniref:ribbon-helix-helix domain-containing protein n=1 Tax=Micrococcus luteus TaxID=1270 RepID=UPI001EE7D3FA|nr:ribbon-helix-helix domain-containing protein [Micrococcus luteus]